MVTWDGEGRREGGGAAARDTRAGGAAQRRYLRPELEPHAIRPCEGGWAVPLRLGEVVIRKVELTRTVAFLDPPVFVSRAPAVYGLLC